MPALSHAGTEPTRRETHACLPSAPTRQQLLPTGLIVGRGNTFGALGGGCPSSRSTSSSGCALHSTRRSTCQLAWIPRR